jgi:hypothetical protein
MAGIPNESSQASPRSSRQQHQPGKLIVERKQGDDGVKFNLGMTTVHRYEVELEDASNAWYSRADVRSFQIGTLRSGQACRQLLEAGRDIFHEENHCIQGIENLVSSASTRRILVSSSLGSLLLFCCVYVVRKMCVLAAFSILSSLL